MQCDPCLEGNLKKPAVIYCQDCNESLCQHCEDYHGRSKTLRTHKLRDLENGPRKQDQKYLEQLKACSCRGQNKESVEFFCKDHGVFCCGKCIISKHRKCNHVDKIEDIVSKVTNKMYDSPLGTIETKIKELTDMASENAQMAGDSYIKVEKRIDEVKDAIDEAFNVLKTKVLSEAKNRKQGLMDEIQQQNQNIETLSMKLNEQKANAETVNNYGTSIDKHIFSHFMETSSLKAMNTTESTIRNSLITRQFTTKEKHSVADIVKRLKEAIELVDKELITGSDSHDNTSPIASAAPKKQVTPVVLSGREQFRRMKEGQRVVRGPEWNSGDQDGGPGGRGTVVEVNEYGRVSVRWDHSGKTYNYYMGYNRWYRLQLAD